MSDPSPDKSRRLKQIADELVDISVALRSSNYQRGQQIYIIACELTGMASTPSHAREIDVIGGTPHEREQVRKLLDDDYHGAYQTTPSTTPQKIVSDLAYAEGFLSEAAQDFGPKWVEVHAKVKAALDHLCMPSATLWNPATEEPKVSGSVWVDYWTKNLTAGCSRFTVGDKLGPNILCWRYRDAPPSMRAADGGAEKP